MKKLALTLGMAVLASASLVAQGTFAFQNNASTLLYAPTDTMGGASTLTRTAYPNVRISIYYGPTSATDASGLTKRATAGASLTGGSLTDTTGQVQISSISGAGRFSGGVYSTDTAGDFKFQVRAWDSSVGATWESFVAANGTGNGSLYGVSSIFTMTSPAAPTTATPLYNFMSSFQLSAVPEPSTYAMAALGLSMLALIRRKKA